MKTEIFELDLFGQKLKAEFTDLVYQADGSVIVSVGDTKVLATAIMSPKAKEGVDFLPLSVEYEEKFYASGKIIGSQFQKREGRPTDEAILSGRVVDRTIRPLFDKWIRNDIQVTTTVISLGQYDPDFLSVIASSLAVSVSSIPINSPASALRVCRNTDGKIILNPTYKQREGAVSDLLVCASDQGINMIEMLSFESSEDEVFEILETSKKVLDQINDFQKNIVSKIGKDKVLIPKPQFNTKMQNIFEEKLQPVLEDMIYSSENNFTSSGKDGLTKVFDFWQKICKESLTDDESFMSSYFLDEKIDDLVHKLALSKNKRFDGRKIDEIRPLFAKAGGVSNVLHGSGLFYRGGTHILAVTTLGGPKDALVVDGMETNKIKHFMLHYNFPPYSVGEVGRFGGLNRRVIGHGALAEKSILPVLPDFDSFPYTIRVVAESMSSNGSTSMASVCASTIALMDAGVPIKRAVAGISSGLMVGNKGFVVLTDIAGPEDHYGDMDFKVSGTTLGITAVQMDVKVLGVSLEILKEAFQRAKIAREKILEVISSEIESPRENISDFAPNVLKIKIAEDQIGLVIGSSGKTINEIKKKTNVSEISIENDGSVYIVGDKDSVVMAKSIIESMTKKFQIGDRVNAVIDKIAPFGAFASISDRIDGLIHISEMSSDPISFLGDLISVGDTVPVIIKDIDEKGRYKLSIKDADPNFFKNKK